MAAHDFNFADSDAEMFGHEPADGNVGLVVDRGGYDADHETARSMPAHLIPASPRDHSHFKTLVVNAHEPQPYGVADDDDRGQHLTALGHNHRLRRNTTARAMLSTAITARE